MGTSCNIAVEREDGTYLQSRVNWDGYPSNMGNQLAYWPTQAEAEALCAKGDIRTLDSGEAEVYKDPTFVPEPQPHPVKDEEYLYVFRNGAWNVMTDSGMDLLLSEIYSA